MSRWGRCDRVSFLGGDRHRTHVYLRAERSQMGSLALRALVRILKSYHDLDGQAVDGGLIADS